MDTDFYKTGCVGRSLPLSSKRSAGEWQKASERRLAAGFGGSDIGGVWIVKAGCKPVLRPQTKDSIKMRPNVCRGVKMF